MLAVLYQKGEIKLGEVPRPKVVRGEAIIRVKLAGICRTDLEIVRGYMDFAGILGHEFVGVVEESEEESWLGKRVVGEINLSCGECEYCLSGLGRHCPRRRVLGILGKDGAFAEYLSLPLSNLHEVPPGISDEAAVFVEPVAAACEILEQVEVKGKRVAVLGDGKLGILAARVLALAEPAELLLVGKHEEKLKLVREHGLSTTLATEFVARIKEEQIKFEVVIEATGRKEGFNLALSAVRPRGVIVQKTTVAQLAEVDLNQVVVNEVTVIGSRCGPFPRALSVLAQGLKVEDLISARYPLVQAEQALKKAGERATLKVLLEVSGD